jgi:hypothetical protein
MGAPASESTDSLRLPTSHSGRSNTPSDGNFPLSIYRPRNRPRNRGSEADTISLADEMQSSDGNIYVLGPNFQPLSNWSTPHLRTDRRGIRYSAWKAPSLDADLGSTLFGRQNRQVLFFCIGFIFPLGTSPPRLSLMRMNIHTDGNKSMDNSILPPPTPRSEPCRRTESDGP